MYLIHNLFYDDLIYMSCLGNSYNPVPPREWNRYENRCVGFSLNQYKLPAYIKGNILQYKKNSSNFTKNQTYASIVKGNWVNGKKVWATQTEKYTNPNINLLKLENQGNYLIPNEIINNKNNINSTKININCIPLPDSVINYALPTNVQSSSSSSNLPTTITTSNSRITIPTYITPPNKKEYIINDGGILICSITENPCTGNIMNKTYSQECFPSTDSDVPGTSTLLCWNNGLQTYYPKTKLTYGNSNNKWPTNSKIIKNY